MSINIQQLNDYIIVPTLDFLSQAASPSIKSESSIKLLLGTMAKESSMCHYIHQIKGIATGAYQQEHNSFNELMQWYQINNKGLLEQAQKLLIVKTTNDYEQLHGNLYWATAVCRLNYYHIRAPLPQPTDIYGLALYWKKYYNRGGKGEVEQFVQSYYKFGVDNI